MKTQIATRRSVNFIQYTFGRDNSASELRQALAAIGESTKATHSQAIKILEARGYNALEMRDPSSAPDGTKARPAVAPDGVAYLAQFNIEAVQHWSKRNEIYLGVFNDKEVLKKLEAKFGAPEISKTWGGAVYTFVVGKDGFLQVTKFAGCGGKSFGISICNA